MAEHYVILLCYYLGAVFYALILSDVSAILIENGLSRQAYRNRIRQVEDFMKAKKLHPLIKEQVRGQRGGVRGGEEDGRRARFGWGQVSITGLDHRSR